MRLYTFFDKMEDSLRSRLSRLPIVYAIIGGTSVVLFWRGVWNIADALERSGGVWAILFSEPISLVISALVMLLSGIFVSFFIGDRIILSGLTHEKKVEEKTEAEVRAEAAILVNIVNKLEHIEKEISHLKGQKKDL